MKNRRTAGKFFEIPQEMRLVGVAVVVSNVGESVEVLPLDLSERGLETADAQVEFGRKVDALPETPLKTALRKPEAALEFRQANVALLFMNFLGREAGDKVFLCIVHEPAGFNQMLQALWCWDGLELHRVDFSAKWGFIISRM